MEKTTILYNYDYVKEILSCPISIKQRFDNNLLKTATNKKVPKMIFDVVFDVSPVFATRCQRIIQTTFDNN